MDARRTKFLLLLRLFVLLCAMSATPGPAPAPHVILWAWSTSDDLGFLATPPARTARPAGVAYLVGEVLVGYGRNVIEVRPRRRSLRLPRDIERTAVVYVAFAPRHRQPLTASAVDGLAERIVALPLLARAERLQLNFEARSSRRADWQRLVSALRRILPRSRALDVTALADWCMDPNFAPHGVERVIPMAYRLGTASATLAAVLAGERAFPAPACRGALGISMDEFERTTPAARSTGRWLYVFAPGAWTPARFAALTSRIELGRDPNASHR